MTSSLTTVDLSRIQFAVTTMFHILWPILTIGLGIFLVIMEAAWLKTGDKDYYRHLRFWSRLFILNFGVGVASGLPLEFEFGTNWAPFSHLAGNFFGNILGFETASAFMLEAGFLGIMMFGWKRVAPAIHFFATCMVAFGASLSALWIMIANSWMQTPAGGHIENGHFVVTSYWQAVFNPAMPWGALHMFVACLETGLFVLGGLSAWYLLKDRHRPFFLKAFKIAVLAAIVITPLQIYLGDGSGQTVFEYQPAKGAALEGHWRTNAQGEPASWSLLAWPDKAEQRNDWSIEVPGVLSLLATHSLTGRVIGLRDFEPRDQPPALPLIYYSFRVMAGIGIGFFLLMLYTLWQWRRGWLTPAKIGANRWLLRAWVFCVPLGYVATECGWIVREVGRQPWVIHGLLRTEDAASALPPITVASSLVVFTLIYLGLFGTFLYFARRILIAGPDLTLEPPERQAGRLIDTRAVYETPDTDTSSREV